MITSRRISRTLTFLDCEYNRHLVNNDQEIPILFAKMAVLEYCGWLEQSFDEIARNCVRAKLRTVKSRQILEDKIESTYGFTYKRNFRPVLAYALGTIRLLNFERELDKDGSLSQLKSDLGGLNVMRREAAHTFTSGRTSRFVAPSLVIAYLNRTEPTLKKMWEVVRL